MDELIKYMLTVDKSDIILNLDKGLSYMVKKGKNKDLARKDAMEMFIINKLKFPLLNDLISKIDIESYTVDISDELIHDNEEFQSIMKIYEKPDENGLQIRVYSEGYQKI